MSNGNIAPIAGTTAPDADNQDPFELPECYEREVTINGESRTYRIYELPEGQIAKVFQTRGKNGQTDQTLMDSFTARVVSSCVRRLDGSAITFGQAQKMRRPLTEQLVKHVMEIHGFDVDAGAQVDAAEKN